MSATKRNKAGRERDPFDYYRTQAWCVDRLIGDCPWISNVKNLLEPNAGDGAIIQAFAESASTRTKVTAWEIQRRFKRRLEKSLEPFRDTEIKIGDALALANQTQDRYELVLTNPAYGIAFELLQSLWSISDDIIFLLRLGFLASGERQPFLRRWPPAIHVLPNRPKYKHKRADSTDYAWMHWNPKGHRFPNNIVNVLNLTPLEERR